MYNLRALTRASPNDANLRTGIDPLGMLRKGGYDSNRNPYFHNTHKHLSNRTNNIFNHIGKPINPLHKGGILPLDIPNGIQTVRNALVAPLVMPKISALLDFQPVIANELVKPTVPQQYALRN